MDYSWLHEDVADGDSGSESNPDDSQTELENRLYSIVHHNDLSKPLPPELAKHYSVESSDNGEVIVILKNSLESLKSEETKYVDNLVNSSGADDEINKKNNADDLNENAKVIVSDVHNFEKLTPKRFRYSNVNLDAAKEKSDGDKIESTISDIDYFKISKSTIYNMRKQGLTNLKIPSSSDSKDWKSAANASFISIGYNQSLDGPEIIKNMADVLLKLNPDTKRTKLLNLAQMLYSANRRSYNRREKRKKAKAIGSSKSLDSSFKINSSSLSNEPDDILISRSPQNTPKKNSSPKLNGSLSLNISSFIPTPTIDLVSDNEVDTSKRKSQHTSKRCKKLSESHIPTKWSKTMVKFYIKPSRKKSKMDLNGILENMKEKTTSDDWKLDPRDEIGVYRPALLPGKDKFRRCPNCSLLGHLMKNCPKPRKISSCFLCGEYFHTGYTCPNKICLKCGIYTPDNSFECVTCYYNTFDNEKTCGVCGQVTHNSETCPDLWRSFHATTEGVKKIPDQVQENKLKYCCNCASKGHFSNNCPFPSCSSEPLSSFVTNYSASPSQKGTAEVLLPYNLSHIVDTTETDSFLQNLSNSTCASIEVEETKRNYVFKISGTFEQCKRVKTNIEEYVNSKKRKRHSEPLIKKKKQRIKF